MTSRIGNKRGFTLIEVMVAVTVLVVGIVFIYESFFFSMDLFGYYSDYLRVASWADEKVWNIQDDIRRYGFLAQIEKRGKVVKNNKNFYWNAACSLIDESPDMDLYKIELKLSWQIGTRKLRLKRTTYATYKYDQERDA